jgi:hypothetical protein
MLADIPQIHHGLDPKIFEFFKTIAAGLSATV